VARDLSVMVIPAFRYNKKCFQTMKAFFIFTSIRASEVSILIFGQKSVEISV
jgi:hypothetical protein